MTTTTQTQPTAPAVTFAHASEIGGRRRQEDAAATGTHRAGWGGYVLAAIADGVGSAPGSHLVAEAAVRAVCAMGAAADFHCDIDQLLTLAAAVLPLHADYAGAEDGLIFDRFADPDGFGPCPDTTIAAAAVLPDGGVDVGWLGDCRVYIRLTDGELFALTTDHNLGEFGSPHVITRSLGHPGKGPQFASWHPDDRPGAWPAQVLLTTDGVHEALPHRAIRCALDNAPTPQRAACWLTRWAVRAAGPTADNATAAVLDIRIEPGRAQ